MSESAQADAAVEQVTQEVKDVKLENGTAPGATNGTAKAAEAISLKVIRRNFTKVPTLVFQLQRLRLRTLEFSNYSYN